MVKLVTYKNLSRKLREKHELVLPPITSNVVSVQDI